MIVTIHGLKPVKRDALIGLVEGIEKMISTAPGQDTVKPRVLIPHDLLPPERITVILEGQTRQQQNNGVAHNICTFLLQIIAGYAISNQPDYAGVDVFLRRPVGNQPNIDGVRFASAAEIEVATEYAACGGIVGHGPWSQT